MHTATAAIARRTGISTARRMAIVACFFAGFLLVDAPAPATMPYTAPAAVPAVAAVDALIDGHGCWTNTAPADTIPGHAVITVPGKAPRLASADLGFRIWLGPDGQPATGDETPGAVHAFCP